MHLDFACALDDIMFLEQRTFNGFVSEWSNTDKPALQICAICLKKCTVCAPRLHHFCFWIKSCVQMTNLCSRMCAACVPWVKWHNSKTVHQFMVTDNKQSANYSSYWSCIICPTELLICACKFTECKIQCTLTKTNNLKSNYLSF